MSGALMGDQHTETVPGPREGSGTADVPTLTFVRDLPGFPGLRDFVLVALDEDATIFELRSLEVEAARFMVMAAGPFFPNYAFDIDDVTADELALDTADDALVVVLVTLGQDFASSTANLLAPVVINASTRHAAQVILQGTDWPVRAPIHQ